MAARFELLSVSDALERSLRNSKGVGAGNSALVATARVLARRIDIIADNGFLDPNGKLDNVTVPTFLKYLQALGMTLETRASGPSAASKGPVRPADMLSAFRREHHA